MFRFLVVAYFNEFFSSLDPTRLLLTFGASTSTQEKTFGNTALHCAVMAKNQIAVTTLIEHNASLEIPNNQV
jgi:palmitoyltransferase ZDHHC13/17